MYTRQIDRRILLELEDEPDEIKIRLEFYKNNLPFLMTVTDIDYRIKRRIAVMLQAKQAYKSDWREFANEIGITGSYELDELQVSAEARNDQPIFFAMSLVISCYGFGKVVKALISTERHDILKDIEPYVKGLLQPNSSSDIKRLAPLEQNALNHAPRTYTGFLPFSKKIKTEPAVMPLSCIQKDNQSRFSPVTFNSTLPSPRTCEYNTFQQSSMNIYSTGALRTSNSAKSGEQVDVAPEEQEKIEQIPTAPPVDCISVLIPHSDLESDVSNAMQLSQNLREAGMIVKTLSDLDMLMLMNSTGALSTMFQEVDFIVPVVSSRYLQQIRPQNYEMYLESDYAMNNRHLYELMMNEYRNNRCVNFRVRPVRVPEMNRQLLMTDVLMSFSLRLWNEVPKLINILKKTKQMNPQSLVR